MYLATGSEQVRKRNSKQIMSNMNDQDGISIASEGKAESDSSSVVADNNNIETPKQQGESLILSPVSASVFKDERTSFNGQQEDNDSSFPVPVGDVKCWKHATGIGSFFSLSWGWVKLNKAQILSGITVALAQVPEAISFSFVAGVDPIVGLQSAWIMGIITSLFGGRPGMVAGSTGAIAVVLPSLVENHGIGYMFYAIMLAGILQIVFGLFRLGVLVRMIPHPVMVGFCNGLGIVIGVAQFNIFKIRPDDEVVEEGERKLLEIGGAFAPFTNGWEWVDGEFSVVELIVMAIHPESIDRFHSCHSLSRTLTFYSNQINLIQFCSNNGWMDGIPHHHCPTHLRILPQDPRRWKNDPCIPCSYHHHHDPRMGPGQTNRIRNKYCQRSPGCQRRFSHSRMDRFQVHRSHASPQW